MVILDKKLNFSDSDPVRSLNGFRMTIFFQINSKVPLIEKWVL